MTEDKKFDQSLLAKMKTVAPKARWRFWLKNIVFWSAAAVSLVLGAAACALILHLASADEWAAFQLTSASWLKFLLLFVPIFWIVCLIVFAILGVYEVRQTKKGYRYSAVAVVLLVIGASFALGWLFHCFGWGIGLDDVLSERAPLYQEVMNPHVRLLSNPTAGLLSGLVLSRPDDDKFIIIDDHGVKWTVVASSSEDLDQANIQIGQAVRLVGQKTADNGFQAQKILPIGSGRGFFHRLKTDPRPPLPIRPGPTCWNATCTLPMQETSR